MLSLNDAPGSCAGIWGHRKHSTAHCEQSLGNPSECKPHQSFGEVAFRKRAVKVIQFSCIITWASVISANATDENLEAESQGKLLRIYLHSSLGGRGERRKKKKKKKHTAAIPKTDLPSATHDLHVTFSRLICTSLTAIDLTRFMQMTP